MFIAIIL
jgi:hypothetical protein